MTLGFVREKILVMEQPAQQPQQNPQKSVSWPKILTTVLVVVFVTAVLTSAVWYFVLNKSETDSDPIKVSTPTKQATSSPKTSTKSANKDETAGWNTLVNEELNYSIKYPLDWSVKKCSSSDSFGTKKQVQSWPESCQTGAHFTVSVYRSGVFKETVDISIKTGQAHYNNFKSEDTTFSGKTAVKTYGINKDTPGLEVGVIFESYYINDEGNKTLVVQYKQNPRNQDYTSIFDKMVSTFKFLD